MKTLETLLVILFFTIIIGCGKNNLMTPVSNNSHIFLFGADSLSLWTELNGHIGLRKTFNLTFDTSIHNISIRFLPKSNMNWGSDSATISLESSTLTNQYDTLIGNLYTLVWGSSIYLPSIPVGQIKNFVLTITLVDSNYSLHYIGAYIFSIYTAD